MAIKIRRIDFSPDEWIAGTQGLTEEEEGLYIRLVARIYSRGRPLALDGLAAYCGSDPRRFHRLVASLESKRKIRISPGDRPEIGPILAIDRCDIELKSARDRAEIAAKLATKRWKNNGVNDAGPHSGTAMLTINHQPSERGVEPSGSTLPLHIDSNESISSPPRKNGHRLPEDWEPSEDDIAFARRCDLDPDEVTAEFRDFWSAEAGQRARKLDWSATYRNRCRAIAARRKPNGHDRIVPERPAPSGPAKPLTEEQIREAERRIASGEAFDPELERRGYL